jgi:NADPH-dependent curcumin reductase CurA
LKRKVIGREIRLRKRPAGFISEDDFEFVETGVHEIKKESEFLVQNIWMSIGPFMRIYIDKGNNTF